ncbi:hypothetical protein GOQ27_15090 [Clostridium sp. D2Q-11]|uniref:Uncharacterized protein n=1 Tax=Anaeromonas frigoriresistens TaxID=2683708 RepID=A0A942Z9Y3_9FIRM|nr:hypothetical protein [Anaeromonas frigoriresistens]MBS4539798.1 hypothetical protein [Anaeromonas frigoriresistens]
MIKDEDKKKLEELKKKTVSNNKKGAVHVKESKDVKIENSKIDIDYDEIRKIFKSELNVRLEEMQKRIFKGFVKSMQDQHDFLRDRIYDNIKITKDANNKLNKLYKAAVKEGSIVDEEEVKRKQEEEKRKAEEQRKKEEKAKILMAELESLGVNVEVKKRNAR